MYMYMYTKGLATALKSHRMSNDDKASSARVLSVECDLLLECNLLLECVLSHSFASLSPSLPLPFVALSSIDMYNNDVGQESAQKIMKQTGDLKAATLYFAS